MSKVKGRNLLIFVDDSAIAGETTCELDQSIETIEVASQTQSEFKEYLTRRKSWSVSCSNLLIIDPSYGNAAKFKSLLGKKVKVSFATTDDSDDERAATSRTSNADLQQTGYAICTDVRITAKNGEYVSGSFTFQGSGALS